MTLEPAFAHAEQAYRDLRRQYEAHSISDQEFDTATRALTIDFGGRYWMIGVQSGVWYVSDGDGWKQADPPQAATAVPAVKATAVPAVKPQSSGGVDWAIMVAALLIAFLCFFFLTRHMFF